jgi:hypothetical protein
MRVLRDGAAIGGGGMSWTQCERVAPILAEHHYLGPIRRGVAWHDRFGVIVVGTPTSRRLPSNWLELVRWCIVSREKNGGSQQWAAFSRALRKLRSDCTTIVSYSDPSQGHTGALYRACNWRWAPTWHRLRPPPTGNGKWQTDTAQSVKDRWVYPLTPDPARAELLLVKDDAILRAEPLARYVEPGGVPFKHFAERLAA